MQSKFGATFDRAVEDALTPSAADVVKARQLILDFLATETSTTEADFRKAWRSAHELPQTVEQSIHVDHPPARGMSTPPDRDEPLLVMRRGSGALQHALVELIADGIVVDAPEGSTSISFEQRGLTTSHILSPDIAASRMDRQTVATVEPGGPRRAA